MSSKIHKHNDKKFRHHATGAWVFHGRRHSKIRTPKKRKDRLKNNTHLPTKLTPSEKAIVQLLSEGATTIQKLADIRKCTESVIYRHLRNLKKKGVVFKYLIERSPQPKHIAPKHMHPLKPWKDPQSLFCSPKLKEIIKKEPANAAEIIAED